MTLPYVWIGVLVSIALPGVLPARFDGGAPSRAQRPPKAAVQDSARDRAALDLAIAEFHLEWQQAWRISEAHRQALANPRRIGSRAIVPFRPAYFHCHAKSAWLGQSLIKYQAARRGKVPAPQRTDSARQAAIQRAGVNDSYAIRDSNFTNIPADSSAFGVCPSWMLTTAVPLVQDEGNWRDGALMAEERPRIRALRTALLARLDESAALRPHDAWLAGQRVRFAIDQRELSRAEAAAAACGAGAWWCDALAGYVLARAGRVPEAEVRFRTMLTHMPAAQHCTWSAVALLLPAPERASYDKLPCAARDSIAENLWWLADPLYRVTGNDRFVEHYSRRVEVALRRATLQDERYHWTNDRGADALEEAVMRFGWPSYTGWAGAQQDRSHSGYLANLSSPPSEPYTTFEYTQGRAHTVPEWDALRSPLDAVADDWLLSVEDPDGRPAVQWWPTEHFRPTRRLVQIGEGQTAFFRRQSQVAVATAVSMKHPSVSDSVQFDVLLLSSPRAGRVDSLAQASVTGRGSVVLQAFLDTVPTLFSVEAMGTHESLLDARTRFAVRPPPALVAMRRGEMALSDVVLLDAATSIGAAEEGEALLARMLPTSYLPASMRTIGLLWESYGIDPGDTVTVSVRVVRDVSVGRLRRIGIALNLASDPSGTVGVSWTEPHPTRSAHTLRGPVTVQVRTLTLQLGTLAPGPYVLEVALRRPNGQRAVTQRRITLLPS